MKRLLFAVSLALAATSASTIARADDSPSTSPPTDEQDPGAIKGAEPAHEHSDPTHGFNFTDLHYTGSPFGGPPAVTNHEGEQEGTPAPFLYLVGNFVLLLLILAWKAAPAVRKSAEKRHDEIKKALDEAAALRAQAKAKLDEYDKKLAAAEKEISSMVDGMRAEAEADKKRIIAAAEAQAAALKKDADERISAEILRARTMLAREVATAASAAAELLLRDKTTAQDQTKLVDTFITEINKPQPASKEIA